ncbi:MAG: hypothetical protein ACFB2Z_03270 [Maricaulaceae bacterium]
MNPVILGFLSLAMAGLGVLGLWRAWASNGPAHGLSVGLGWGGVLGALALMGLAAGFEVGLAFAAAAVMTMGLIGVGFSARWAKAGVRAERETRLDPAVRAPRWTRAALRGLIAGPLAAFAALAVGLMIATRAPLSDIDRIALGGLFIPLGWAAGMAWALADPRLIRAGVGLLGLSVVFGVGVLV